MVRCTAEVRTGACRLRLALGSVWHSPDGVSSNNRSVPVDHGMTAVSVSIPLAHHRPVHFAGQQRELGTFSPFLAGCSGNPLCAIFSVFSGFNLHSRKMRRYR